MDQSHLDASLLRLKAITSNKVTVEKLSRCRDHCDVADCEQHTLSCSTAGQPVLRVRHAHLFTSSFETSRLASALPCTWFAVTFWSLQAEHASMHCQ